MIGRSRHPFAQVPRNHSGWWILTRALPLLAVAFLGSGCAALSNPVADGVPVSKVPPQLLAESKKNFAKVPLTALQKEQDEVYRLGAGDILGIWIGEGILGERNVPPQARFFESSDLPPAFGTPIAVRENGTISLPQLQPIDVRGLTLEELEQKLRQLYTDERKIFLQGHESVIVTLMKRRTYSIFVLREDGGGAITTSGGTGYGLLGQQTTAQVGGGSGRLIQLAAGENDILTALTRSGGLPGFGAEDEVIIERGGYHLQRLGNETTERKTEGPRFLRIPLRIRKGTPIPFTAKDVILNDGDCVYVRARKGEYYYTGGLLPTKKGILPRDEDLDVVQAISESGGILISGTTSASNLSGSVGSSGLGSPNPNLVSVLRRTPDGGQINIHVDLNKAFRDPAERILLASGDIVILQLTPGQALVQYFTGQIHFEFVNHLLKTPTSTIDQTATGP
jgi:Polysaccharide biosynthesis/export protein